MSPLYLIKRVLGQTVFDFILATINLVLKKVTQVAVVSLLTRVLIETINLAFLLLTGVIEDRVVSCIISLLFRVVIVCLNAIKIRVY